jgi:hypothetical protein
MYHYNKGTVKVMMDTNAHSRDCRALLHAYDVGVGRYHRCSFYCSTPRVTCMSRFSNGTRTPESDWNGRWQRENVSCEQSGVCCVVSRRCSFPTDARQPPVRIERPLIIKIGVHDPTPTELESILVSSVPAERPVHSLDAANARSRRRQAPGQKLDAATRAHPTK